MIGFEIEIDLAVTDANGDLIDGDTDLATSTTVPGFKLVSDSRTLNDDNDYSNLEFVTDAVSVIGGQSVVGPQSLNAQFLEVQRIRDVLYNAGSAPLQGVDGALTAVGEGLTARLDPTLDYDESGALLVHYSVGIPLAGMPQFFDRLRAVAPVLPWVQGDNSALIRDRFSLHRARLFAASELQIFHNQPQAPQAGSREARSLDGYLQLAYMQICALADHLDYDGTGGNIKNLTAVLCRSAFIDIFPLLPVVAQQYLTNRCAGEGPIVGNLADFQEEPEQGYQGRHTFWEEGIRQSGELDPITLAEFTASVLTGNARVNPERVFGGMREIAPHLEENVRLVPMELRSINNEAKTWNEVQNELANLCTWCQEAFLLA